jgi:hypothetical protein
MCSRNLAAGIPDTSAPTFSRRVTSPGSFEHQPTSIKDGIAPPFVDQKGAPHINTFLRFVPSIVVPAGFTEDDLPVGITLLGRPYDDARMIQLAYGYEQATRHRRPPKTTPRTTQSAAVPGKTGIDNGRWRPYCYVT